MAECQPLMLRLMYRYRGQAPSHSKWRYGDGREKVVSPLEI